MIYDIIIFLSFSGMIACCVLGALSKEKKPEPEPKLEIAKVNWMAFTN